MTVVEDALSMTPIEFMKLYLGLSDEKIYDIARYKERYGKTHKQGRQTTEQALIQELVSQEYSASGEYMTLDEILDTKYSGENREFVIQLTGVVPQKNRSERRNHTSKTDDNDVRLY